MKEIRSKHRRLNQYIELARKVRQFSRGARRFVTSVSSYQLVNTVHPYDWRGRIFGCNLSRLLPLAYPKSLDWFFPCSPCWFERRKICETFSMFTFTAFPRSNTVLFAPTTPYSLTSSRRHASVDSSGVLTPPAVVDGLHRPTWRAPKRNGGNVC